MTDDGLTRLVDDTPISLREFWTGNGMPWRKLPEIHEERQAFLAERRHTKPDISAGIFPFKDVILSRADVEWLLATHESGGIRGPVNWEELSQRSRIGIDLRGAILDGEDLSSLPLARLRAGFLDDEWDASTVEQRKLASVSMRNANLHYTHLEGSYISYANFQGAFMNWAHLESADMYGARFDTSESSYPASLARVYFSADTNLNHLKLTAQKGVSPFLVDIHWGSANVAVVDWQGVRLTADEDIARRRLTQDGHPMDKTERIKRFSDAVRTYIQLATVLRAQGKSDDADKFAYRSQRVNRQVLVRTGKWGRWSWSLFLDMLAGYGYAPLRTLLVYVVVVFGFAGVYIALCPPNLSLSFVAAVVLSVASFHGRGFFPAPTLPLDSPIVVCGAIEAVIGLVIEASFIATFTQRFFGR